MLIKGWVRVTHTQILAKAAFGFAHKRFANVKMWLEKGVPQRMRFALALKPLVKFKL